MSDLPTKEEAIQHAGVERHDRISFPILLAYGDGRLIDRNKVDTDEMAMLLFERMGYVGEPNPELFTDVRWAFDTAFGVGESDDE